MKKEIQENAIALVELDVLPTTESSDDFYSDLDFESNWDSPRAKWKWWASPFGVKAYFFKLELVREDYAKFGIQQFTYIATMCYF